MPIEERISRIVSEWPSWSKAERKRMPQIIEEVIEHCKNGNGNGNGNEFISQWCETNLPKMFSRKDEKPMPSVPFLLDQLCDVVRLLSETCATLEEESPGAAECGYWSQEQKLVYEKAKEILRASNRACPED